MRRRASRLVTATAAVVIAVPIVAGCEAKVYGTPPEPAGPLLTVVAPQGSMAPLPEAPPDEPAATFDGLAARARLATAEAARAGADISAIVLDRNTGQTVSAGNESLPIASVAKLFIADDLLLQEANGQTQLSPPTARRWTSCFGRLTTAPPRCSGTAAADPRSSRASLRATGWVRRRRPTTGAGSTP